MSLWGAIGSIAGSYFGPAGSAIGGAIGNAIDGSNAQNKAASQQQAATDAALGEQKRQFDLTRSDYAPWREAGGRALGQLETDINKPVTAADVMSDPGYQFGLQQGQQAIDRKIAAGGGRVSGAAIKAAARYGTDYGSTKYGEAYSRKQDRLNRLAALAGIGQTAVSGSAQAGQNYGNQFSNLTTAQGNANAAATLGRANTWGNAANQIAALYGRNAGGGGYGAGGSQGYFTQWGSGGGFGSGVDGMGD
jgi:hypothetical protein